MRYLLQIILILLLTSNHSGFPAMAAPSASPELTTGDELISGYMTVFDEQGNIVLETGHQVNPGDQYISDDDTLYEITAVEGAVAHCRTIEKLSSAAPDNAIFVQAAAPDAPKPRIAIYHTHSDESYIPNAGSPTKPGNGQVMLVGSTLAERLTELGYKVDHSKTAHDPHDANAYHRSRRTALKLLQKQPDAIFDIHRDSAPLSAYSTTIDGQNVCKLMLVVGQQNQNRQTTRDFARSIKRATDDKYRGLIRGIFLARGNYNQDLSPRAMLIEVGTESNTLEAAERAITLFATVIPSFIGSGGNSGGVAQAGQAGTYTDMGGDNTGGETAAGNGAYVPTDTAPGYDILGMLLAVAVGAAAFLFLATGSWQEAKSKLKRFFKYEFVNFLGSRKKRKD